MDSSSTEKTTRRTMFRWLSVELGMCSDRSKFFSRFTPQKAWAKAYPYERYMVMSAVGIQHNETRCPYCNDNAQSNKTLPAKVLKDFRKWQRAKR